MAAAALKYAKGLELIGAEAARRMIQLMIGLVLVIFGNFMPKDIARYGASARAVSPSQSARRVAGWSLTLADLGQSPLSGPLPRSRLHPSPRW